MNVSFIGMSICIPICTHPFLLPILYMKKKRELNFYEIQDQFFDNLMKTCFDDIGEVVEYLKEDMSLM